MIGMAQSQATNPDKPTTKADKPGTKAALNPRQRSFIAEYIKDKNATQAYMRAYGVSRETAERAGPRLMGNVVVKSEIDRQLSDALEEVKQKTGVTLERVITELARIAFFDPRAMFNPDGTPKAVHELDDDTAAVVAGLDVLEQYESDGAGGRQLTGHVKKWKLAPKDAALDKLMKHLGGYAEDNKHKVEVSEGPPSDPQDLARRLAFVLRRGLQAANDPKQPPAAKTA